MKYEPNFNFSYSDWVDSTEALIRDAVKIRLNSDVKIGTFLSGGIDSNLITYFANELLNYKIKSYTIGFENKNYDESNIAKESASNFNITNIQHILNFKMTVLTLVN